MIIGEVIKKTGLTKRAIGYYEDEGLINPVKNKDNNYREYSRDDVDILVKISLFRQLGLSINDIKELVRDTASISKVLASHLDKIEKDMQRLEKIKNTINEITVNSTIVNSEDFIVKLKSLRDDIESDDKCKIGYIRRQLLAIFPGAYGKIIIAHFSPFLDEPVNTREKSAAWSEIIEYLDEAEPIIFPEEYLSMYTQVQEDFWNQLAQSNRESVQKLLYATPQELDTYKSEIVESIKSMQDNKEFKEIRSKMWNTTLSVKNQLSENGYYEQFIKNLRILSSDYDKYQEILAKLNSELGLEYGENGEILIGK